MYEHLKGTSAGRSLASPYCAAFETEKPCHNPLKVPFEQHERRLWLRNVRMTSCTAFFCIPEGVVDYNNLQWEKKIAFGKEFESTSIPFN